MTQSWKFWGKLENGVRVYCGEAGHISVERDAVCLEKPTPEEKQEIYRRWPGLIDKPTPINLRPKKNPEIEVIELTGDIAKMEIDAMERKSTIAALKYANDEKEKMILSFMKDVEELKGRIDTLHHTNRKWKEEVERRDGTIEALMWQIKEGRALEDGE
jgi:hypothetical protein